MDRFEALQAKGDARSDSESSSDEESEEGYVRDGGPADHLGISQELADKNYYSAGTEVQEEGDKITVENHRDLIHPEVDALLYDLVDELKMKYLPSDFQRVSINALGQQMNVVLVSPTGSGKMNVPLLGTLVIRKKLNNPKG